MNKRLPVFLSFHVEPNGLYIDKEERVNWTGFEKAFESIEKLRTSGLIEHDIKFIWLVRADPQIKIVYGDEGWGLKNYESELSKLYDSGDDIGIHVHPYRLTGDDNDWVQDFSDEDWICNCVTMAFNSFKSVRGIPPLSMSIGPNSNTTKVVNHCRKLGIKYDFTLSHNGKKSFNQKPGEIRGAMNWQKKLPLYPYTPSKSDLAIEEDNGDGFFIIPVHYFSLNHGVMNIKGLVRKLVNGKSDYRKVKPSLSMDPALFKSILSNTEKRKLNYLLIDTRTHVFDQPKQLKNIIENLKLLNDLNGQSIDIVTPGLELSVTSE